MPTYSELEATLDHLQDEKFLLSQLEKTTRTYLRETFLRTFSPTNYTSISDLQCNKMREHVLEFFENMESTMEDVLAEIEVKMASARESIAYLENEQVRKDHQWEVDH